MSDNNQKTQIIQHLENGLAKSAKTTHDRPKLTLTIAALFTLLSLFAARNLGLDADLSELLPRTFPSVQGLDKLRERFGGVGFVVVMGEGKDPEKLKQFVRDVSPRLEKLDEVRWVDFKRPTEFIQDHLLYFVDQGDLEEILDMVSTRMDYERQQRNPLYIDLEESEPPEFDTSELEAKYGGNDDSAWLSAQLSNEYYIDTDRNLIALLAKPADMSLDLNYARKLVGDIQDEVGKMDLSPYGEDFKVHYTGTYVKKIDQQALIEKDLRIATILAVFLMLLYLGWHFRRVMAVFLIFTPLVLGLVWTFGLATLLFEKLNILTGFIGAILLGLGIAHGIHLLGRYQHEWALSSDEKLSIKRSFGNTGRAVIIAALTTMVAFAGLGTSEFAAFHEFGVIAATGMALIVLAYATVLPSLLAIAHSFKWDPGGTRKVEVAPFITWLPGHAKRVLWISGVVVLSLFFLIPKSHFNHDIQSLAASQLPSFELDLISNQLLGYVQTPLVVLTENEEDERRTAAALRKHAKSFGDESTIDFIAAGIDLVPENQAAKEPIIAEIGDALKGVKGKWLPKEYRQWFKQAKRMVKAKPFTRKELPIEIRRQFQSDSGNAEDGFVLVFPAIALYDGDDVVRFARQVRSVPQPDNKEIVAVGEPLIMADVFEMVAKEAPPVLTIVVLLVILTLWLLLARLRDAVLSLIPAAITISSTLGLLWLVNLELNYLNIVMIPVLFGTGVDGGVHLVTRMRCKENQDQTLTETGRAVAAAILITALGFGSLLIADHSGLNSLGALAILGLGTNLLAALLILPAAIKLRKPEASETSTEDLNRKVLKPKKFILK